MMYIRKIYEGTRLLPGHAGAKLTVLAILSIVIGLLLTAGCSLLGAVIGAAHDVGKPDEIILPGWQLEEVKPGQSIGVSLYDGDSISGWFVALGDAPDDVCEQFYAEDQEALETAFGLPGLNDSVTVIDKKGTTLEGLFRGFSYTGSPTGTAEAAVRLLISASAAEINFPLSETVNIESSELSFAPPDSLRSLIASGRIASINSLWLETYAGMQYYPVNRIREASFPNKHNGLLTGFLIGLTIDVAIIIVAAATWPDCMSLSCPYVYSFDGAEYQLDTEPLDMAVKRSWERTDLDVLDRMVATEGEYRIRITNELPEVQYINQVNLKAVIHSTGSEVAMTTRGLVTSLSETYAPAHTWDLRGFDVPGLVTKQDGEYWVSNPLADFSVGGEYARDGLILEFDCPLDAASARLAFDLKTTYWAANVISHRLSILEGEAERIEVYNVVCDQSALKVDVWNGQDWSCADAVWGIGPVVARRIVVPVALKSMPTQTLRVRLNSPPGFWMIDRVAASFAPYRELTILECPLLSAIDNNGGNLRDALEAIDQSYYVMPNPGDYAELVFRAPAVEPGMIASPLFECTGYYRTEFAPLPLAGNIDSLCSMSLGQLSRATFSSYLARRVGP